MKRDLKITYPGSERALEYYKTSNTVGGRYCTMCGPNFCAMKISHTLCDE